MPVTKNSPVFVGENLGQLITPTAPDHQCRHWRSIPGGITNSYLVASVATINLISSRNKDNEDQFDFGDHVWEYKDQFLFTVCHDRCKTQPENCHKHPQNLTKKDTGVKKWQKGCPKDKADIWSPQPGNKSRIGAT
jgi:hypothetical protein